jgi:maleate isomerase
MNGCIDFDSMMGARVRLGVVVLSTNLTVEYEFRQMVPEGVSFHVARMLIPDTARDGEEKEKDFLEAEDALLRAVREVSMARPDIILFACTVGSFIRGPGNDQSISARITTETGIRSITTSSAVLKALECLRLKKISLVSPYPEGMGTKEREFLETSIPGLRVVTTKHMGVVNSFEKNLVPLAMTYRLAKEVVSKEADGLFISCTALRTMEMIDLLERELQIPVITSVQASLWACLRECGVRGPAGFGRLFKLHER